MARPKKGRILVKFVSTAGTGYYYVGSKNPKKTGGKKLSYKKYDPKKRQHVMFEEARLK